MNSQPEINSVTHLDIGQRNQVRDRTAVEDLFQPRFCQQGSHVSSEKSRIYDVMSEKMTSNDKNDHIDEANKKDIVNEDKSMELRLKEDECIFWYGILYAIGSYMIKAARGANINSNDKVTHTSKKKSTSDGSTTVVSEVDIMYDHIITRLFCGYWILYTIAVNAENVKNNT